jgi:rhodanese-related sulfurtransferase
MTALPHKGGFRMAVASITPQQLGEIAKRGSVDLIDVRTPAEYEELHVTGVPHE